VRLAKDPSAGASNYSGAFSGLHTGGRQATNHAIILVVANELKIRYALRTTLSNCGYDVILAKEGQEAIKIVNHERPDLILLDVNMPGMSGFEAYSKIRVLFQGPIVMVRVRNSEHDRIVALDSGADGVVVKPFAIGELLARIRAVLRRSTSEEPLPKIDTPELKVDLDKRMVNVFGKKVQLSLKEFDLLRLLVISEGKCLRVSESCKLSGDRITLRSQRTFVS
jgi:DNA-binding response OmpR family regulator